MYSVIECQRQITRLHGDVNALMLDAASTRSEIIRQNRYRKIATRYTLIARWYERLAKAY